jgi:hypothetical protein
VEQRVYRLENSDILYEGSVPQETKNQCNNYQVNNELENVVQGILGVAGFYDFVHLFISRRKKVPTNNKNGRRAKAPPGGSDSAPDTVEGWDYKL